MIFIFYPLEKSSRIKQIKYNLLDRYDILLVSDHLANQPGRGSVGVAEILLASGQQRFRYDAAVSGREGGGVARGISPFHGLFSKF